MANNTVAYGFLNLEHLFSQQLDAVGTQVITSAVRESAAEHTRAINALLASLVERTTMHQERFWLPGSKTLQPLDEHGNPLPTAVAGYFDVAYPIQGGGDAWGANRVARALMTVEDVNRQTIEALKADADWIRRHVLAALYDNATWTFDDEKNGDLTIQPLANGDTVVYNKIGGAAATDTHYLAQAAAILDGSNPFPTIYSELIEHPTNQGPVVVYTPSNLVDSIAALTSFVEVGDPDILVGNATDQLGRVIDRGLGDEVLGKASKCWIVEWRALPDNYMIAHAQGAGPVLKMREYPSAALQGFFAENHSPDGNLQLMRMIRYAGFGVANRIAAVAYRIGNAAYAIPTGYGAPLAV